MKTIAEEQYASMLQTDKSETTISEREEYQSNTDENISNGEDIIDLLTISSNGVKNSILNDSVCDMERPTLDEPDMAGNNDSESEDEAGSNSSCGDYEKKQDFYEEQAERDDTIMFPEANMSVSDVMFMIVGYCLRFHVSQTARQ